MQFVLPKLFFFEVCSEVTTNCIIEDEENSFDDIYNNNLADDATSAVVHKAKELLSYADFKTMLVSCFD